MNQLNKLVAIIEAANRRYYNFDQTGVEITDTEYDNLKQQLEQLNPTHPLLRQVGVQAMGVVHDHTHPVGSQEKLKTREDYDRWYQKVQEAGGQRLILQEKLDGLTVVLYYRDGKLIRALTRGDGAKGEDVTKNVVYMQNVLRQLPKPFSGYMRGEVMLNKSTFKLVFEPIGFANPRNTAAGKLRDQKANAEILKHFKVIYFDQYEEGINYDTEEQILSSIMSLGLDVVTYWIYDTAEEAWQKYESYKSARSGMDHEIDGVIVRANDLTAQARLGVSSDLRPKGQRCIKFEAANGVTTLINVKVSIGHTGAIVPSAMVAPVEIGGVTVSNVFLNNYEEIDRLDIHIGDKVEIIRAGDVIPKIVGVHAPGNPRGKIVAPSSCPHCDSTLIKDGAHIFCRNDDCEGQKLRKLKTWVAKREIKYLGDSLLELLYTQYGIKEPWQLYTLNEKFIADCGRGNGIVGSAANKIVAEINKSRTSTLPDFLGSLAIPFLGRRQVEIMMGTCGYNTVSDFQAATIAELEKCEGFSDGSTKARAIVIGIAKSKELIRKMLEHVQVQESHKSGKVSGKCTGVVLCFTGVRPKPDEHERFTALGGVIKDNMSKAVTHLVMKHKDSSSAKAQKAAQLGANLMSYDEFVAMLQP